MLELLVELVGEFIARAAGPRALRAAGLDHEVRDDAVELQAIIKALGGKFLEVGTVLGTLSACRTAGVPLLVSIVAIFIVRLSICLSSWKRHHGACPRGAMFDH